MKCRRCRAALTPQQIYRRGRYCSLACANRLARVTAPRPEVLEWQHVLGLLGYEWYVTLSDIALLRYGEDGRLELRRARTSIWRIRQAGYAIESRNLPWPNHDRESIRGYRLVAEAREAAA
jgi:hypothetical protein